LFCGIHTFPEAFYVDTRQSEVLVTVTGDFVSGIDHSPNDVRQVLCDATEKEKSSHNTKLLQNVKEALHIVLHLPVLQNAVHEPAVYFEAFRIRFRKGFDIHCKRIEPLGSVVGEDFMCHLTCPL
jgi:hypothetical protein